MKINGEEVDIAKMEKARKIFGQNRTYGNKGLLTFDELRERLSDDQNSIAKVAEEHGVTPQMMSQIYKKYFRGWLPGHRTGYQRRTISCLKRLDDRAHEAPKQGILAFLMKRATRFGYDAKRVQLGSLKDRVDPVFYTNLIEIQGRVCLVSHLTAAHAPNPNSKKKYGRLHVGSHTECDFRIIVTDFPGFRRKVFIVPSKLFPEKYMGFYVPEKRSAIAYKNHHPVVDWFAHKDAWNLFQA